MADDSGPDILDIIHNFEENKHLMTPANLGKMLQKCPIDHLEEAWNYVASPTQCSNVDDETDSSSTNNITQWSPVQSFKDVDKRAYHRYHPAVMETGAKTFCVLSTLDYGVTWVALPPLNFLPPGCGRVIAGSAGLVVMDGGEQPGDGPIRLWGKLLVPNARFWEDDKARRKCGGQSLVCVANPLTREFILLPPIPKRRVHGKVAKFMFSSLERASYHLVIAGWDKKLKKKQNVVAETLCVVVYSEEEQKFVHANYIDHARPSGRTGMAIINYGVYLGGQRVDDDDVCAPAIYYFNISDLRRTSACFDFNLRKYMGGREVEAPQVVQAGPDRVFAVTRYAHIPTILWMVEVQLQRDGTPTGRYRKLQNGVMPPEMYQRLFPTEGEALRPYECSSADGVIGFKVYSKRNLVVLYNIHICEWKLLEFPSCQPDQKTFQLCNGCYEPVFTARP